MDRPGAVIAGKYELHELAGAGGMATVWRATQAGAAGFRRTVAIKRIRAELARDEQFVAMFVEEARVCASFSHPNIVQIHDFGVDEQGLYFLVMEWVEGLSLSRFLGALREQSILPPWHLVAAIAIESLRGLGAAHERIDAKGLPTPVFHRDVTPQNILLADAGHVKLTDFGLARAMDRARMTAPHIVKGKVGYIAPELAMAKQPTEQTDLYALGVVLWQALAGQKLFKGDNDIDIFIEASRGEVTPLCDVRPDVPPRFAGIVERALARDPGDRFRSANQMRRIIANLLREVPQRPDQKMLAQCVREATRFLVDGSPTSMPPTARLPDEGS